MASTRPPQASFVLFRPDHPKRQINLLRGWPAPSLLPAAILKEAAGRVLSDPAIAVPALQYGPDPGDLRLRKVLAKWFGGFYNSDQTSDPELLSHERITITGGASQSLGVILAAVTDPVYTQTVWMAAPAYFMAARIFQDGGFAKQGKLRAVPEDEEGIDVDYLRKELEQADQSPLPDRSQAFKPQHLYPKLYRHLIYVVPAFSNPSATTMSLRRRQGLVRLAREFDALIVCDDVYDMLRWPADVAGHNDLQSSLPSPIPRIVDVDRTLDGGPKDQFGNVISNGSFSKICGPGTRTGWVEATTELSYLISQAGTSKSGGSPSHFTGVCLGDLLETGELQNHIAQVLQPSYASRYKVMREAIVKHLVPLGVSLPQHEGSVAGGYFLWFELPGGLKGVDVASKSLVDENLGVAAGERFEVPGDIAVKFPHHIRVCFAWEDEEKLQEGMERLASVIQNMLKTGNALSKETTDLAKSLGSNLH